MFFDRRRSSGSFSTGDPTTLGEVWDRDVEAGRYANNVNAGVRATEEAYDARIDAVAKATGVRLVNPFRSPVGSTGGMFGQETADPFAFFDSELNRLAENRPELRDTIAPHRSPRQDAEGKAMRVDTEAENVYDRAPTGAGLVRFAAGFRASLEDPVNVASMLAGPTGRVGVGAKEILWMGLKAGAANAAVEASLQPVIQSWRQQAGLDYGASHAALNIATAGALGFGLDAGVRSAVRGVQAARGQVPVLDADGKVSGYRPADATVEVPDLTAGGQTPAGAASLPADPDAALEAAARAAPEGSTLREAQQGNREALDRLARELGMADDPAVRGARLAIDLEAGDWRAAGILDADGYDAMINALRAADDPDAVPPKGADATPEARGPVLADDVPAPAARFEKDGKPVSFRSFTPDQLTADPAVFQFRRQVNHAGTTGRMSGIQVWDPLASGKTVVFQRRNGEFVIADGHHRLELAKRLADQKPELQGYLFREADGWTADDVRAYAAKKNMMDSPRVDPIDAASALRARPDLIDKSVAVGDETMRQARALARLSDEAFGMVVGGVLPPNYAALVGDLMPDKSRHASLVAELSSIEPANVREARFALAEIMALPTTAETQATLFGAFRFERSLMKERMGVLDAALRSLKDDKKVFALLDREAGRIEAAGNKLDEAGNAARMEEAARLSGVIEQLAVTRGPVSDWLSDAARAVAAGMTKKQAADAFARRVASTLETDGLRGLMADEAPLRAGGFDEPMGPDAQAQIKGLEASLAREIEAATKPEKAAERHAVLLDVSRPRDTTSLPGYGTPAFEAARRFNFGDEVVVGYDAAIERLTAAAAMKAGPRGLAAEKQAIILLGPPGAGKSSIGDDLALITRSAIVTSDDPKFVLPEFDGGRGSSAVHEEASYIAGSVRHRLMDRGANVIVEKLGSNSGSIERLAASLAEEGYAIRVVAVSAPREVLLPRIAQRAARTGRTVPIEEVDANLAGLAETVASLRQNAQLRGILEIDNGGDLPQILSGRDIFGNAEDLESALRQSGLARRSRGQSRAETGRGAAAKGERSQGSAAGATQDVAATSFLDVNRAVHTPAAARQWGEIAKEIIATIPMLPRDVRLRVEENLVLGGQGADGMWDGYDRIVYVSLAAADPVRTVRHEAVHALRQSGLMSDGEFDTLYKFADRLGLRGAYEIDKLYKQNYSKLYGDQGEAYVEALLREETIANMFADYSVNGRRFGEFDGGGVIDQIIGEIVRFMKELRDKLLGYGFRHVTDIFEDIESGRMASRGGIPAEAQAELAAFAAVREGEYLVRRRGETYYIHRSAVDHTAPAASARDLGRPIGSATVTGDETFRPVRADPDAVFVDIVEVSQRQRGKGVGTALYDAIENDLGKKLRPSGALTEDGYAFWKRRAPEAVADYVQRPTSGAYSPLDDILADMPRLAARVAELEADGRYPQALAIAQQLLQQSKDIAAQHGRFVDLTSDMAAVERIGDVKDVVEACKA